ncbi:MAG: methyltransferase [Verrucomicrobia bacterium]|nr:methyltransferase [Verrucomicrobiota bacterium]
MKSSGENPGKELYRQLRGLTFEQLWRVEAPRFDQASPQERITRVSVIRALSVVGVESGTPAQRECVRPWLRRLLHDPAEKVRRYAMAALAKIGAGEGDETEMLALLRTTTSEREQKSLGRTLVKIGGTATLQELAAATGAGGLLQPAEQKLKANVARAENPSAIRLPATLTNFGDLRIHLRGRRGLQKIVAEEVGEYIRKHGKFRLAGMGDGLVVLTPVAPFSLADLYSLRCFGTVGFVLGTVSASAGIGSLDAMAAAITSPRTRRILAALTDGSIRYRLQFVSPGFPKDAVQQLALRAYARCPEILNDSTRAPWTISIQPARREHTVELSPNLFPDPRLAYRLQDMPASSHPPLAACLARLGGRVENDVVWDPFCGSGLELVERALLGGVRHIFGSDLNPEAVTIAERNFAAAKVAGVEAQFTRCAFHEFGKIKGLGPDTATLILTNPPMGRRIRIPDLRGLIKEFINAAATVLKPGGRLVFANPFRMDNPHSHLKLHFREKVDMGGFDCAVEKYVKLAR